MPKTAILYARVSTKGQADKGYSLAQQLEALRAHAAREGYEVLAETARPERNDTLDRPGLDQVRDLVEGGGVSVVLAQDRDRFGREPYQLAFLEDEFKRHGCVLKTLGPDDDDSPEGQLMKGIWDQLAKYEKAKTAERTRRGKLRKAREGKVVCSGVPNYGFRFNDARDGYEVDEACMDVVRRIFREVGGEGASVTAVNRALEAERMPAPNGGKEWSRAFITNVLEDDVYKPHTHAELSALVSEGLLAPDVLARLNPDEPHGVWRYNRHRLDPIAVPVPDAGIPREWVDAAREYAKGGERSPRKDQRPWELTGGALYCGECGRRMQSRTATLTRSGGRKVRYRYYICPRKKKKTYDACPNRNHPAAALETRVAGAVAGLLRDPAPLIRGMNERIESERRKLRRNPDDSVKDLERVAANLDNERKGYQRQNAKGWMTDEELALELARLKDERAAVEAKLEQALNRRQHVEALERDAALVLMLYTAGVVTDLDKLPPEERRDLYRRMRLRVVLGADGEPEISADLLGSDAPVPSVEAAREAVKGRARFDPKNPHEWLNRTGDRIIGHEGADVYTVPEGVYRAYKELSRAGHKDGRAVMREETALGGPGRCTGWR